MVMSCDCLYVRPGSNLEQIHVQNDETVLPSSKEHQKKKYLKHYGRAWNTTTKTAKSTHVHQEYGNMYQCHALDIHAFS